jgi:predicted metal-dependent RNase
VLIVESTRGDTDRDPDYTRWREGERLAMMIEDCLDGAGSVMIPVFAMGKTQETVMLLYELQRARQIRSMPFHIGGLSIKMTKIYDRFTNRVRRHHRGLHMLRTQGLLSVPQERGVVPELHGGQIYAVSSGMMSEHTMSNRLGRQFISNPRNLLVGVGYADPASPMARVFGSEQGDEVVLDKRHDPVKRECSLGRFDLSGHAPREHLVDYVAQLNPEITLFVHGDKIAIERTKAEIEARVPDTKVLVPEPLETIDIG